jgi:hypothetical protein
MKSSSKLEWPLGTGLYVPPASARNNVSGPAKKTLPELRKSGFAGLHDSE